MEKTIYIDEKQVKLKSTAALPKRYKAQFGRDYFADLMKVAKVFGKGTKRNFGIQDISFASLDHMDMEVFYDIIWTMAKTADRTIPDPLEWLDGFEVFPLNEIMGEVKDLLTDTMPTSKKKVSDKDSSSGEPFTNESFFYVCRQVGLTSEDMEEMTIGDCLDYVQEYIDNQKKDENPTARKATQEDFDNF